MIIALFVSLYILSAILSYLLFRYNFVHQLDLKWTRSDRTLVIMFSLFPLTGFVSALIIVIIYSKLLSKLNITGNDEVDW